MAELPRGTVTTLFTDIEGSTRLLRKLGSDAYREELELHRELLRAAFGRHGGQEVEMVGDSFHFAFARASDAVAAAAEAQRALADAQWPAGEPIRVRVGIHTGEPAAAEDLYVGLDIHRAARVMAAAHGGQVLVSEPTAVLVRGELPPELTLRDLGEHRLKDLSEPQRLFQLGEGEFPPLKTLHQTNLPVQPTPLIGREPEIGEVLRLLRREDVQVVTLTGAGGSGKTRLAMQTAAEAVDDYPDGVWFVPLAALTDPSLVVATIAEAFGLREGGGRTFGEVLGDYLRSRRLLLVLDNLEQLLPHVAVPVAELAAAGPALDLLATSRELLRIAAEHEHPVFPLRAADATTLFAERAKAVRPGFELDGDHEIVGTICQRLDRLPLAIELAAARVRALPPAKLLERLEQRLPLLTGSARDAPDRQRTLRATIAWSHDLLDEEERQLFARFAVFSGGCTLEAAEAVCDADLDTLTALIEKNLIRQEDGPDGERRYAMLETIREFALERLDETTESEEIRRRHAEHLLVFALAAEPELSRSEQRRWLDRLEADHDNFRAALRWLLDRGDPETALRLARALGLFWYKRGHIREGRDTLLASLERASLRASETRARALDYAGLFCAELDEEGRAFAEQAVACAREAEAPAALALALCHVVLWSDRIDESVAVLEEARAIAEAAGDPLALGIALNNLGVFTGEQGDAERVQALFEESYRVRAGMGDLAWMSLSLINLAETAHSLGDTARARKLATRALELAREVGDRREAGGAVIALAWVALDEHRPDEARELFIEALALAHALSHPTGVRVVLQGLAAVAAATRDGPLAARLASAAEHAPSTGFAYYASAAQSALLERHLAAVRAETDPVAWEEAWRQGSEMSIEEATVEILDAAAVK